MTSLPPWWRRLVDSRWTPVALVGVFVIAIVFTITLHGVWIDESATLLLVGPHSYGELLDYTTYDVHPPLWYLILKPWLQVFGNTVLAARSQSAVFMIAAVIVWYHFVRTRYSRPVALLGLALTVTNPMVIHYAVEGRMYACGILLTAITTTLITGRHRRRWFAYWPLAVAMLYVHFFLTFVLAAQFLYLLLDRKDQGVTIRWLVIYGASIVLAFAPWLPLAFQMTSGVVSRGFWIPPVVPSRVEGYVLHAFLHRLDADLVGWRVFPTLIYLATFTAVLIRAGRNGGPSRGVLWCLVGVPWLFLLALSSKIAVFHPRYVIFGLLALITLMAFGALRLTPRWRAFAIVVLLVGHIVGYREMRSFGYNDHQPRYWAMKKIAKEVSRPVNGEQATIVGTWLFTFFDAKVTLGHKMHVVHLRENPPTPGTFPDVMYYDHPEWVVDKLEDVSTRYAWTLEDVLRPPTEVPSNWKLLRTHRRGYARTRLFEILPGTAGGASATR